MKDFLIVSKQNLLSISVSPTMLPIEARTRGNGSSAPTTRATSPGQLLKFNSNNNSNGNNQLNRFIVLGSSGEALPVNRKSIAQSSVYNSLSSHQSTDSFHSAKDTIDDEQSVLGIVFNNFFFYIYHTKRTITYTKNQKNFTENEEDEQKLTRRYSTQLDTPERRGTFAQRLKEALRRESSATSSSNESSESSYAVGISVAGSRVTDTNIKFVYATMKIYSLIIFYIATILQIITPLTYKKKIEK